jgi:hypothetical protein
VEEKQERCMREIEINDFNAKSRIDGLPIIKEQRGRKCLQ